MARVVESSCPGHNFRVARPEFDAKCGDDFLLARDAAGIDECTSSRQLSWSNRSGPSWDEGLGIRDLLYVSFVFWFRLATFLAIGGPFAIIDAAFRNASVVTPMALRRVFVARHRA